MEKKAKKVLDGTGLEGMAHTIGWFNEEDGEMTLKSCQKGKSELQQKQARLLSQNS